MAVFFPTVALALLVRLLKGAGRALTSYAPKNDDDPLALEAHRMYDV